jgi:hypothetical protein
MNQLLHPFYFRSHRASTSNPTGGTLFSVGSLRHQACPHGVRDLPLRALERRGQIWVRLRSNILFDLHAGGNNTNICRSVRNDEAIVVVQCNSNVRVGPLNWSMNKLWIDARNFQMSGAPSLTKNNPQRPMRIRKLGHCSQRSCPPRQECRKMTQHV